MERGGVGKTHGSNKQYAAGEGWSDSSAEPEDRCALIFVKKAIALLGFLVIVACVTVLWIFMGAEFGIPGLIIALVILLIVTGFWRKIWIGLVTGPRDAK